MKTKALWCDLLIFTLLCSSAALADKKDELYFMGMAYVNAGDALSARDAFCAIAKVDPGYKDASAQCQTYSPLAEKTLFRYKQQYADGMAALQHGDYATAEIKFRNVKAGDLAEHAREKLAEIPLLKAQDQREADERSAAATQASAVAHKKEYDQVLHMGDSGANFVAACSNVGDFDESRFYGTASPAAYFCAGWIKGAAQEGISAEGKTVEGSFPPIDLTIGQETQLLLRYVSDHPESKDSSAASLLKIALQKAFPCERAKIESPSH
jgi:hypothetical protein